MSVWETGSKGQTLLFPIGIGIGQSRFLPKKKGGEPDLPKFVSNHFFERYQGTFEKPLKRAIWTANVCMLK